MKQNVPNLTNKSKKIADKLFKAISTIGSEEEARKFFEDLCTPAEIQAMADRWRVVKLIKQKNRIEKFMRIRE